MSDPAAGISQIGIWWDQYNTEVQICLLTGERMALVDTAAHHADFGPATIGGRNIADIDMVLNTHAHADHVGGNGLVKRLSDASFCIHRDDAGFLEDTGLCFDRFYGPAVEATSGEVAAAQSRAAFVEMMADVPPADRLLENGDVVDLGNGLEIEVVHLPGHTPGSSGYYCAREGVLIAGDCIAGLGVPDGTLPLVFDLKAYERSVRRLLDMPIERLYAAHPYRALRLPFATSWTGDEVRIFLEDSKEAACRLLDALDKVPPTEERSSIRQVTDLVVAKLPAEMGFKTTAELVAPDFSLMTVLAALET